MSRMGVSPLLPLCAFLLTITLHVNSSPLPKIDSPGDVINERVKDDVETLFNGTDKNQDGKITLEEFTNIPDGGKANKEYNELLFAFADVDRDGLLTLDEFLHFFQQLAPDSNQNVNNQDLRRIINANEWFKIYDTNHDGQISPEEALATVDHQHSNTKSLSKLATLVLFDKADGDQDSRLKFLEFVIFLTSVEDTLKNAETTDQLNSKNNSTEETVTDYLEAAEGVTGSVPSDSAEVADSQPKTAPPEWAPFIQTTTETPLAVADSVDKALLPPPLIADTSNEFNFTSIDKGSAEAEEEVVADFTTTQSTTTEEMKAETQPFVAGGDFMEDPAPEADILAFAPSEPSATSTESTTSALVQDNFRQAEQSSESAVDGKQVDWEKTLTDDKLSPAEELELAALVNQMDETTTEAPSPSSSTGGVLPPSVAPVDIIEEAPSVESATASDPIAGANKAILEMADQDTDNKITMAEAFDFVRVFMRVSDYLILESLFVQNDQDGDRKLNPNEYVAFLKALVNRCNEVTEDSCVEMQIATYGVQEPADAFPFPIMIDEPSTEAPTDILETSFESSTALPEIPSSTAAPLPTDIPILILQPPQSAESENAEDKSGEESMKPAELSSGEQALIAAMLKEAAQVKSAEDSSPIAETSKSSEEFVPILIVEPPQETTNAETLTDEDKEKLIELLLEQAGEIEPDADTLNQPSEAAENIETTSRDPEEFAEKMELIGFGGDVDMTTTTQAGPVMSEESEQKLTDVEVMRVSEGDFHYFVRMHNAMYLFFIALILLLLLVVLAIVIARRIYSRREKIYNVT